MDFLFSIIVLILSVVVHEVSHGYAAYYLGDKTAYEQGRLTINPMKHLDPMGSIIVPALFYILGGFIIGWAKPVPYNPYNLRARRWGEAIVAGAGPLSNIAIAMVFGFVIRFGGESLSVSLVSACATVVFINILLAVFNLMPIPPLDGSKLLFSVLPAKAYKFKSYLERNSLIFLLIYIFFLWQVLFPIVGFLFSTMTGIGT